MGLITAGLLPVAACCGFHAALHIAALPLLRALLPSSFTCHLHDLEPHMRIKLSRLVRGMVYSVFALACGIILLLRCRSLWDLCRVFTPLHDIAFLVALGHWLVSFVEDWLATNRAFIIRWPNNPGLERLALARGTHKVNRYGCLVHHLMAAAAFAFLRRTRLLGGMGAIGLLYEGPIIAMNLREMLVDFEDPLGWSRKLGGRRALRAVALSTLALFLPCRFGGDAVYVYALVWYDRGLGRLPHHVQVACHAFAGFFVLLNCCGGPIVLGTALDDARFMTLAAVPSGAARAEDGIAAAVQEEAEEEDVPLQLAEGVEEADVPAERLAKRRTTSTSRTQRPAASGAATPMDDAELPMRHYSWWWLPTLFVGAEMGCFIWRNTTLMGVVTGGTYGHVQGSTLMTVHIYAALLMWALGAVQLMGKRLRRTWPRVHRLSGAIFLLDWALVVGPTSFYLSLVIRGDGLFGTVASMSLLDVTFLSYYFFYRAWRVARERDRTPGSAKGARSLQMHGNLMGFGTLATMNQLPQRVFMLLLMAIRELAYLLLRHVIGSPGGAILVREWLTDPAMFGLSMFLGPIVTLATIDGPRTPWFRKASVRNPLYHVFWGASDAEEREMYPYEAEACAARWRWRSRVLVFALARGAATSWWSRDPTPTW
jgi:hypothetical protein